MNGKGTAPKDEKRGLAFLESAVELEDSNAQAVYGEVLWDGQHGQRVNRTRAAQLWRTAAAQGNARARGNLEESRLRL